MRKSLILIITFISTLILIGIYHSQDVQAVQSDISGSTTGGSPATIGSSSRGYTLWNGGAGIKVSLVDISGNAPQEIDQYYLMHSDYKWLLGSGYYNEEGANRVCGLIKKNGYATTCVNAKEKMEYVSAYTFRDPGWGTKISKTKIENYLSNEKNFNKIMNKFNLSGIITENTFDINEVKSNPKDVQNLMNYRVIVEPIYSMAIDYDAGVGYPEKIQFATLKAWARITQQRNQTWDEHAVGVSVIAMIENIYTTKDHGSITKADFKGLSSYKDYYNKLANVTTGYGYGMFYILGECDETKSCCYDESGKYHGEYFGKYRIDSNGKILPNYKIENGKVTSCRPCDKTIGCCYDANGVYQPNFKEDEGAYKNVNGTLKECKVSDKPKSCFAPTSTDPLEFNCNENSRTNTSKLAPDEPISINKTIYSNEEGYEDISKSDCGLDETTGLSYIEKEISGYVQIRQDVTQEIERSNSVKSGRGFTISAEYNLTASYETCELITVKIKDRYWDEDSKECKYIEKTKYIEYKDEDLKKLSETNPDIRLFLEEVQEQVESKTEVLNGMNAQTKTYSSNVVENHNSEPTTTIGKWNLDDYKISEDSDNKTWYPGEKIGYTLNFSLQNACINRQTAEVTYTNGSCNEETQLNGGQLYYVPVKQENGTTFPYKISIDDLSIIKDHTWRLSYTCGVKCTNDLIIKGKYKIIYRPIEISNPFDKKDMFPKWTEREKLNYWNWYNFMKLDDSIIENKISRNKLEYEINLYPETIKDIKKYNTGKNYTSLTTINRYGTSTFLNGEEVKLDIQKRPTVGLNNYNHLGECTNNCWMGGGKQE